MSFEKIMINGIEVEVKRKAIKNIHLAVYPPHGVVRVSAPLNMKNDNIRLLIISRMGWIKKQREKFEKQLRQSRREYVSGESHYLWGQRYLLNVIFHDGPAKVQLRNKKYIDLYVRKQATREQREQVMNSWYREQLKAEIPDLIAKWEPIIDVQVNEWGVKKMRTKWGTCNVEAKRIWLNFHLVKKPPHCLEYVVVHEMTHLLERNHTSRFIELMDRFYPKWRVVKEELNNFMLDFEEAFDQ